MLFAPKQKPAAAFTIMEVVVAMGIGLIIMTGFLSFALYSARSFAALSNYMMLNQRSQQTLDRVTRDIRQCEGVFSFETNKITLIYSNGTAKLSYQWYPTNDPVNVALRGQFIRSWDDGSSGETLLRDCHDLRFSMYQRTSETNKFLQNATTQKQFCKELQVNWTCRRSVLGQFRNSESVQTARVVIRDK